MLIGIGQKWPKMIPKTRNKKNNKDMTNVFTCLMKKKFGNGNGSGMDRDCIGNGPVKSRNIFSMISANTPPVGNRAASRLFLVLLILISGGQRVWGEAKVYEDRKENGPAKIHAQLQTDIYDITWIVNGDEWTAGSPSTSADYNTKVESLPTAPGKSDCDDLKEFVGWTTIEDYSNETDAPTVLFTTAGESPVITENTTFYAVFAERQSSTIIWSEDWTGEKNNSIPSGPTSNGGYAISGATITYSWTDGVGTSAGGTKVYSGSNAGGTTPEAMIGKQGTGDGTASGYLTISGIPKEGASTLTLSFKRNYAPTLSITGTGYSIGEVSGSNPYTATITAGSDETFDITFTNDDKKNNIRLDDISVSANVTSHKNYSTTCADCDSDPSFNNTPSITDIDCDGATVTVTDGLSSLGSGDGCHIRNYGFVWSTNTNPTIESYTGGNVYTVEENIDENVTFDHTITGLSSATHYYVRAYAQNKHGIAYSTQQDFYTPGVSSIAITTAPTQTVYWAGAKFNTSGIAVTATLPNGSTNDVTSSCTYSPSTETDLTAEDTYVTISYTDECSNVRSADQSISVYTLTITPSGANKDESVSFDANLGILLAKCNSNRTCVIEATGTTVTYNGDGTYSVAAPTCNATITATFRAATNVEVTYKVNGITISTESIKENTQATPPSGSTLTTAMSTAGVSIPAENYANLVGWVTTPFYGQTSTPNFVNNHPVINAATTFHAVFSNCERIRVDNSEITKNSYPKDDLDTLTLNEKELYYNYIMKANATNSWFLQFKKGSTDYGRIFNNDALTNIMRVEIGASGNNDCVSVYVCSSAGEAEEDALTDVGSSPDKYVYQFPEDESYFIVRGDNSHVHYINYIDIYYNLSGSTERYICQTRNSTTAGNWSTAGNWDEGVVPGANDIAHLTKAMIVDADKQVAEVVICKDGTNAGSLEISAGKGLVVEGKVRAYDGSFKATSEEDIVIGSTLAAGTGALVMGSHDGTNKATVNFAVKAKRKLVESKKQWINQFIGTPFNDETAVLYNYYETQLYRYHPAQNGNTGGNWWSKLSSSDGMTPFLGYNLMRSKENDHTLWMQGTLVESSDVTLSIANENLYYNGSSRTENLLANSWIAPIHIAAFTNDDFTNVEKTIYIFNAGTPEEQGSHSTADGSASNNTAGQYIVLPINSAEWTNPIIKVIPAMQAFSVFATGSNASLTLDYSKIVLDPALDSIAASKGIGVVPTRAPKRTTEEAPEVIKVRVAAESGYAAHAYILGREDFTEGFDDGWDGRFMEGDEAAPQLYAPSSDGKMAISCVPNIEGTVLNFRKGTKDATYTVSFDYNGEENWYLNDQKTNQATLIGQDNTYLFNAADTDNEARFVISKSPIANKPTGIDVIPIEGARKILVNDHIYIVRAGRMYDITGKRVQTIQ